jgi:hypothetical protein
MQTLTARQHTRDELLAARVAKPSFQRDRQRAGAEQSDGHCVRCVFDGRLCPVLLR